MLSEKLFLGVGVDTFAGENSFRRHKSAARIAFFRPWAVTSGPGRHLGAFSSYEQGSYWRWGLPKSS
jgi:hypothetical protein